MTIWNFGSINADYFYAVPALPAPGETVAARALTTGLGGKGANQSVAAAKAGADVRHIGAVGADGIWAIERLEGYGVDTAGIRKVDVPTAHAIIAVEDDGENSIIIFPGANAEATPAAVAEALAAAETGDILLLQNETTCQVDAARIGWEKGLYVIYSAAPFAADAVEEVMPYLSLLVMNAYEATQLTEALGSELKGLSVPEILITRGASGSDWYVAAEDRTVTVPARKVTAVDTTAAGDTFIGYVAASLDAGMEMPRAMERASAAAALKVQRRGTADAIPDLEEVRALLGE